MVDMSKVVTRLPSTGYCSPVSKGVRYGLERQRVESLWWCWAFSIRHHDPCGFNVCLRW